MQAISEKLGATVDLMLIPLQLKENLAFILYLKSVADNQKIQEVIIKPFFEMKSTQHFEAYIQSLPDLVKMEKDNELLLKLTKGHVLVATNTEYYLLDFRFVHTSSIQQTLMEPTIYGPQLGLSEDVETNLNIIRHRYHEPTLMMEAMEFKDKSHQTIAIVYDKKAVKDKVLKAVQKKLKELDVPLIQSAGDLQRYLNGSNVSLFPTLILTERPDRITYNLAAGKVILLVDGSPQALIAPTLFFDFMVSMEDNYHSFWISAFTLFLRYVGLLTCIILPAMYVAITSYNPDVFRVELALSVAGSRIGVPYPSFIEVLFMLLFMEFLTEASIRLPKAISATATTVGGLILGTAATEAALTSNIMIIIVSAVAITSFVIPISEMSFSIRICRYLLIVFTTLFGTVGLMLGFLGIIMFLANKDSYGEPYLKVYWRNSKQEKEV